MIKLPEGVRATLTLYFKTEADGEETDITIKLDGFPSVPEFQSEIDIPKVMKAAGFDDAIDIAKTRLMTAAEITEYRRAEDEEGGDA